jgi:hypothetical protein
MNHTFATEVSKSCAVFSRNGEDWEQESVWLNLFDALQFLNRVRDANPYASYVLLFRVDA